MKFKFKIQQYQTEAVEQTVISQITPKLGAILNSRVHNLRWTHFRSPGTSQVDFAKFSSLANSMNLQLVPFWNILLPMAKPIKPSSIILMLYCQ